MKIDLKKTLGILMLLVIAAFALTGCDGKEPAAVEAPAAEVAPVEVASVEDVVDAYFANMPAHGYKVAYTDVIDMVKAGEDMTLLDIRRADDYAAGHITGAVNLAWGSTDLADQVANIPQEGNVFVYCYSGQTSGQAVALMNLVGIPARSVTFGFKYGVATVEGYEEIVDTTVYTLPALANDIDATLLAVYTGYYEDMAAAVGSNFASNVLSEANAKAIFDAADPDVVFVSIRKADAFAAGHIEGATNMPWGNTMHEMFDSLPADKKIVIYCYSGQTAGQTVGMLRALGYDAVSLKGGMGVPGNAPMGWGTRGYPVVASN